MIGIAPRNTRSLRALHGTCAWGMSCLDDSDGGAWGGGGGWVVLAVAGWGGADCEAHLWGVVRGDGKGGGKAGRWGGGERRVVVGGGGDGWR